MKTQEHRVSVVTATQESALQAAKRYLAACPTSYRGLLRCLEQEGYAPADAAYAADHCGADWDRQAVRYARRCLSERPFPLRQLIERMQAEGFTEAQARYGASKNGY